MARVLFVNRFYWPDEPATGQLLTDLAEALAAKGHEVTVIASQPVAVGDGPAAERRGVNIVRIRSTRGSRQNLGAKALDFGTFFFGAAWQLWRRTRRGNIIVAMTNPPLFGIAAGWVARLRGARLIHWVQDIYPELAIELTSHRWLRVLRPLRNVAWRGAARCVTLGADMASVIADAGVGRERIAVIPNWAPVGVEPPKPRAANPLRAAWGLNGKFVVAYSGNLGRVHDLDPILAVAEALRNEPAIAFIFVGSGAQQASLATEASRRGLRNVAFHPPQPRARLAESLSVGDVHWVTLRPGCERFVFPSKLHGITAIGRPVIFIGPRQCDVARCVKENDLGYVASREEISEIAADVRRLAAEPPERARFAAAAGRFAATHRAEHAAERWHGLLVDVAGSHPIGVSANQRSST